MENSPQNALAKVVPATSVSRFRLVPSSFGEACEMAKLISESEMCPPSYRGKWKDVLLAYEFGASLGLSWMAALQNVSVINSRCALWGDAVPALIMGTGECERFHNPMPDEGVKEAFCIIKRKGYPDEFKSTFSLNDARVAGLLDKKGPWQTYPRRMLQLRARGFAARDAFPDKLSGLILAEEAMDYVDAEVIRSEPVVTIPPAVAALERLPDEVRKHIETAFEALSLSPAMRLTQLNAFLGGDNDVDAGAVKLIEWARDEYAKRKTGQPRKPKGEGNGKNNPRVPDGRVVTAPEGPKTPAEQEAPQAKEGETVSPASGKPAGADAQTLPLKNDPEGTPHGLTADEIFRANPSVPGPKQDSLVGF